MSVAAWLGLGRAIIGGAILLIAILRQLNPSGYPVGDPRSDPVIWAVINGAFALLGLIFLISALIPVVRSRSN